MPDAGAKCVTGIDLRGAMSDEHWTFDECVKHTAEKIASAAVTVASAENRQSYIRIQVEAAMNKALRHGRSGRANNDPVVD
jgi:hypothetical protein